MKQIPFSLKGQDRYKLDEYIVSSSNENAYHTIKEWPKSWGVAPYGLALLIRGGKSSGKTFLAKTWANNINAIFFSPNTEISEELISKHDAFVIDDIDQNWEQENLLHLFNICHEYKKYLLLTTTSKKINFTLRDLDSRIKSIKHVSINTIDDNLMTMLIFKLFSNYSVSIDSKIINYLVGYLPREFDLIINAVGQINEFALQSKRRITIPLVKETLDL